MPTQADMPGQELVEEGLTDLRAARLSIAGLLVAAARTRLAATGLEIPSVATERPTHALYELLASEDPATAHGRYNALVRRLVSYMRAAEHATPR